MAGREIKAGQLILFDTRGVVKYLGGTISRRTVEGWRATGEGPPFVVISRRCVRYRKADLDSWLESKLRTSTADPGRQVA